MKLATIKIDGKETAGLVTPSGVLLIEVLNRRRWSRRPAKAGRSGE